jgi:hypothetical protein
MQFYPQDERREQMNLMAACGKLTAFTAGFFPAGVGRGFYACVVRPVYPAAAR